MNSAKNKDYIDLLEVAKSLWAYKFLLVSLAIIVGMGFIVRTEFFTKDRYVATGKMYVSNREQVNSDDEISEQDINTARTMSVTYQEILKTRDFLALISEDIDNKFSWGQIRSMTSIKPVGDTEIMQISVTAYNPQDAYLVAESILRNAPDELKSVLNGKVSILEEVVPPSGPVSNGTTRQGILGAIVGFIIGCAIVVVMNLFDTKIHKSEDVATRYNVSILGEIAQ